LKKTKTLIIDGSEKERKRLIKNYHKYDLLITSYSFFQRDASFYKKEKVIFNYAVLDEAQYIKNFRTKNAQVVKEINADYRLALSGTPLENSVSELWSIFEFLMPGFLGRYSNFAKKYINPIKKTGDQKALRELQNKVSVFILRRTKDSVLKELPAKTINNITLELSDDQSILYQRVLADLKKDLFSDNGKEKEFKKSYIHILAAITKLRQICNHPNLILKKEDYRKYNSAKMDIFINLVKEIKSEDRKVLVFSQFKTMLNILAKELNREKIENISLTGESRNRDKIIDKFNEEKDLTVFLISLKAGGVGLNLTSADNVIIFDP
jgi:SNF2 family DNA or RNA helicase